MFKLRGIVVLAVVSLCVGVVLFLSPTAFAARPYCGDGVCHPTEDCSTCPEDCGTCESVCGDGVCDPDEDCSTCPEDCGECPTIDIESMDASGDSMTKAVNADTKNCTNDDQEWLNWSTSDTHGTDLCGDGGEGVMSHAETIECSRGVDIYSAYPNSAVSGAQMLKDFVNQANSVSSNLSAQTAPRYVTVLMGHNDVCAGTIDKYQTSCELGSDQDPDNYCRTTPEAFEREFRKGLDILITVPDLKIGVAAMVRVSQLCNHGSKRACSTFGRMSCQQLWEQAAGMSGSIIAGLENGICGSLTVDCSDERIIDAFNTAKAFRDILAGVTAEYAAIAEGGASNVVTVGGETVGGATKAAGVSLVLSDAPWKYKFTADHLTCCDCFHPSKQGQNDLSRVVFDGLTCSSSDVCCDETGDPLTDGLCGQEDTSGTYYPGFF